jgi:hypothetical protein
MVAFCEANNKQWNTIEKISTLSLDKHSPEVPNLRSGKNPLYDGNPTSIERVIFAYGMTRPLKFYELLNEMAIDPSTRLNSFLLLKTFLILEGAPTYYLIDSILFNTVVHSALIDTEVSVFQTAVIILTILLPIVAFKACPLLNQLLYILLRAIQWEIGYPKRTYILIASH